MMLKLTSGGHHKVLNVLLLRSGFRMIVIINAQVTKKDRPRLPATWDKVLDVYRFAKSAKIRL